MAGTGQGEDVYKVYYWDPQKVMQGGPGRSEFIKLVLEEAGVPYMMVHDKVLELFRQGQWTGYPVFAVPVIEKGGFSLSQTGVACRYLGKKHGLYPASEEDEWHADQINTTVHDYIGEGRLAFHGKNWAASYFDQVEETKPYQELFVKERMPKFLQHFEKALAANKGGRGFMVGDSVTYVDLAVLHVLRATQSQFPEAWEAQKTSIPLLVAFKDRMSERPRLKAYFASSRCLPFSGNSMM
ncbi:glutathione S-transferase-like [Babylonia areolata]|uniref:glutathione S-transferase-like n=1 Tax=Babylonia areolata TaxID=304850 RepID=UPI003FD05A52